MPDYTVNRRLKKIIKEVYHTTPLEFSSKYDDKKGQKTYNILKEINGISNKMLDEILTAYPEINKVWLLTGEGEMLLSNNPKICNEEKSDNITLSREVFDLIKNQAEAILSQQKTIENLASKVKESIVPQEGNAMNADAAGFSDK